MALWGISTATELASNQYNLPKYVKQVARANSRHDVFADTRGWVQRHYRGSERSGISTRYYDEILVPIPGIAGTGGYSVSIGSTLAGLGLAQPVAVFFEDPNKASNISVGGGATTGIGTGRTGYVHVVFNELVFAGAGATVRIRAFDANNANETTAIVATAASVTPGSTVANWTYQYPSAGVGTITNAGGPQLTTNYNGQITNRVAFAFTAPSTVLTANVPFTTSVTTAGQTVAIGATQIFVDSLTNVSAGSSLTVAGKLTNVPVVSVGSTFVYIGTASTISSTITAGLGVTFSTRTNATKLFIDMSSGFVGVITDMYFGTGVTSSFPSDAIRQVGGAGTYLSVQRDGSTPVGLGTTTLTITA
jgi:hypothetical protein